MDLAAEWEQGVTQWTREHRHRRLRTASSSGRRVVPSGSLRRSTFPSRRRPVLAPIRRRTSRPPPRPSAARPPASSPRICAAARTPAAPPATPLRRSARQADNTRRCPELVSRCCNRRRAARAARRTHDRERAFADRADAWLPGLGRREARTTRRRSATDYKPRKAACTDSVQAQAKRSAAVRPRARGAHITASVSSTADRRTPRGWQ